MTREEALLLLGRLGAPDRLRTHAGLVREALDEILDGLKRLGIEDLDADYAAAGVILHDAGKVLHPNELDGAGRRHEEAGEALLLRHGVEPRIARVCRTHASWQEPGTTLEELLVALADTLWKGKRVADLEARLLDGLLARSGAERWGLYVQLDDLWESVASRGDERLERSREFT